VERKKRIAFLGIKGLPSLGGADRVVEGIANNLAEDFDITVYCSRSFSRDFDPSHLRLVKIRHPGGKHLFSFSLSLLSALDALLLRRFDLVNVHNTDSGFVVPLLRLRYKTIGTSHGFPYRREKWGTLARLFFRVSERLMLAFATQTTCVSEPVASEMERIYGKRVEFIPNGIDPPRTAEDPALLDEYGLREGGYICFAAGRVDPTKGLHILLEAFRELDRDTRLVAIGDFTHKRDYTEELHKMADERVTFVPFISRKEVLFDIVKRAKLFVFPSTVEAMSIMLLEVASLGVPVVCSDIPENVSVLGDRTVYFRSGDYRDLRARIVECLERYDEILPRSRETSRWVLETYDWQRIARKYQDLYERFL